MKRILKIDPGILFDAWSFFPIVSVWLEPMVMGCVSNALTAIYLTNWSDAACAENSVAHFGIEKGKMPKIRNTFPLTVGTIGRNSPKNAK